MTTLYHPPGGEDAFEPFQVPDGVNVDYYIKKGFLKSLPESASPIAKPKKENFSIPQNVLDSILEPITEEEERNYALENKAPKTGKKK